ncbi:MAG: hypothetical protein ACJ8FT_08695 [Sphingomonas sp.]
MTGMRWGFLVGFGLSLGSAVGAAPPHKAASAPPGVARLMQSCDAHKFETVVDAVVDGRPEKSKVKLCGVQGQSDADWIKTLHDAVSKLEANHQMAPAERDQIVTAINREIERLSSTNDAGAGTASPAQPLSRDYSALPPLPPPRQAVAPPLASVEKDFTVLPPLPEAPATAPVIALAAPTPTIPAPRLTIACQMPEDMTDNSPCVELERETTLIVRTAEDVRPGIALAIVREGEPRAEIPMGGLRKGGTLRIALPARVCSGFVAEHVELRITHDGPKGTEILRSDGPYRLRC